MQISAYNDKQSSWGAQLVAAAKARGHNAELLGLNDWPTLRGYFFARVEQFAPLHKQSKEHALRVSALPGVTPIINPREVEHYERKDLQAACFSEHGMPTTFVCRTPKQAQDALYQLGVPLVSKAAFGSSSSNVRLIQTAEEALLEATLALGHGLPATNKRGKQKGYVIWQRFLRGNPYVYRVAAVGRYRWVLRVNNRSDAPFASGSGSYAPVTAFDSEALRVLRAADRFFTSNRMSWCAVDMARDPFTDEWQVLETTLAWNMRAPTANAACPVVDGNMARPHDKGYFGRDMWQLLLDELEAGAFDAVELSPANVAKLVSASRELLDATKVTL